MCGASDRVASVTQDFIVALEGYWAPATGQLKFYRCPLAESCLPGSNGSRSVCAQGYTGLLCSGCDFGYFLQYGVCVQVRFGLEVFA